MRTIWEDSDKVDVGHLTEYETHFELVKVFNCPKLFFSDILPPVGRDEVSTKKKYLSKY